MTLHDDFNKFKQGEVYNTGITQTEYKNQMLFGLKIYEQMQRTGLRPDQERLTPSELDMVQVAIRKIKRNLNLIEE